MPLGLYDVVQLALGAGFALLAYFLYSPRPAWVAVHKVAKLRTAEDVAAGHDTHPEPVWSSHVHKSDGVLPEVRRIARD